MVESPICIEKAAELCQQLLTAVHKGAASLATILPANKLADLLRSTEALLRAEPTLVELSDFAQPETQVFVFGDTHGHFPDVAHMVDQLGYPSPTRVYVFNGDYVDRGSWGVEVLAFLCAMKCAAPASVYMLRGNHESSTCTKYYGYYQEVRAKYGKQAKDVYAASKRLFSALPLAALLRNNTLVMHGGLFRRPPEPKRGAKRRKPGHPSRGGAARGGELQAGSLDDLRRANKGGMDPDGCGSSLLATDVLWSDPVAAPGCRENDARGVGLVFGPDVTEAFLTANRLRLIIRSHEGPDARDKRSDLPQVLQGYSVDHTTPAGQLVTVFSAPDYPQFQAAAGEEDEEEEAQQQGAKQGQEAAAAEAKPAGDAQGQGASTADGGTGGGGGGGNAGPTRRPGQRYDNLAAVAVLSAPDYATPVMRTFAAVKPRPKADPYYDFAACCDSDTEGPEGGSEGGSEGATGGSGAASEADMEADGEGEVTGPAPQQQLQQQAQAGAAAGPSAADAAACGCGAEAEGGSRSMGELGAEAAEGRGEAAASAGDAEAGSAQPMEVAEAEAGQDGAAQALTASAAGGDCGRCDMDACAPPGATPDPAAVRPPCPAAGADGAGSSVEAGSAGATAARSNGHGEAAQEAGEGLVAGPSASEQQPVAAAAAVEVGSVRGDVEMAEAGPGPLPGAPAAPGGEGQPGGGQPAPLNGSK